MKRTLLAAITLLLLNLPQARAQLSPADSALLFNETYLDTVQVHKKVIINDYTLIGVNAGVTFSRMLFNPPRDHEFRFSPQYYSIYYTRYGKMFDYIPYFGVKLGVEYGHEGFRFKTNSSGRTGHDNGVTDCDMTLISVPAMAEIHMDVDPIKIMLDLGIYGGYRLTINRSGTSSGSLPAEYTNAWRSYENRWDYGLQGGAGIAFMFDPVEIHLGAMARWGWSNLYPPDYLDETYHPAPNNSYYYRFAAPLDIMVYAGIHFQLTKRKGKTIKQLRKQAWETVYGKPEDTEGEDK